MRFILASVVLAGHFGMHGGTGPFISRGLRYNFFNAFWYEGNVAVYLFFIISGFFMIQSLSNSNSAIEYLIKRVLRIFPLFILLSCIAFLGTHNIHNLLQALTLNAFGGNFNYNMNYEPTFHLDFNSSWTLKNEFLCYLLLLFIYKVVNTKKLYFLIVTMLFVILDLIYFVKVGGRGFLGFSIFGNGNLNFDLVSFLPMFLVSSAIYLYKDYIPVNKHTILFSFFLLFIFMFFNIDIAKTLGLLLIIPYLLIAICSKVKIQLWTKMGDYSYGIYLIHPIIYNNLGSYFFPHYQRNITNLIIVYVITVFLSVISWHLIEKPAIQLKHRLSK